MSDSSIDVRYTEEVSAHPVFSVIIIAFMGFMVYLSVTVPDGIPQKLLVFILLVLGFVYANFMTLKITVSQTKLTVGFGVIKYHIRLDNIESVEIKHPHWYWYGGLGVRFGWDFSIAYIQNYRRGVMVTPRKGRRLFFSTNNPETVAAIIQERIG